MPHLNYLRSFEASARLLSFTAAAAELNYTQSAVSAHVRSLEEFIGRPLFLRFPRSLALTSLGEAYLPSVRHALAQVDAATEAIMSPRHESRVVVSCPISLATNWLPPAAGSVRGDPSRHRRDRRGPHLDRRGTGTGRYPHRRDAARRDAERGDACSGRTGLSCCAGPGSRWTARPCARPMQLRAARLIHNLGRPDYWHAVGRHFGLTDLNPTGGTRTNSLNAAMELAVEGLGAAVVPRMVGRTLSGPRVADRASGRRHRKRLGQHAVGRKPADHARGTAAACLPRGRRGRRGGRVGRVRPAGARLRGRRRAPPAPARGAPCRG